MSFTHDFSVPAYYPNFRCKTSECRRPCCTGWDIAVSMQEYFRILGMNCSPELRRRLDSAFHMATNPSEDRYAVISPRWDGDCPLHLSNGLCSLHCECGEKAIPSICRYYPRSPKTQYAYQCQCANSCEGVVEMLFDYNEPMTFTRRRLTFRFSESVPHENDPMAKLFPRIQRACLHVLQDRAYPLAQRLIRLGELIRTMDIPYMQGDVEGLRAVLPLSAEADKEDVTTESLRNAELADALTHIRDLLVHLREDNVPLSEHAKIALDLLMMSDAEPIGNETLALWERYADEMATLFPDNDRMLEQIFVNHLCYDVFPFSDDRRTLWDSYLAFCTAYALVRILSVCHLAAYRASDDTQGLTPTQAYADIVASIFRLVEHTRFAHNAAILARRFSYDTPAQVSLLCRL